MGRRKRQKTTKKAAEEVPAKEVTLTSTTPVHGEWDSLPPEIQEIILKNVDTPKGLLSCRGVNSTWKDVADATLEKQCLSGWLTWTPFSVPERSWRQTPNLPAVMKVRHVWVGRPGQTLIQRLAWTHSSLPTVKNPELGSPFPGNSMHLTTSDCIDGKNRETTMVKELGINYGHHLTSFVLTNFTTNFDDLSDLLRRMLNLKALTLKSVGVEPSFTLVKKYRRGKNRTQNGIIMQPYQLSDSLSQRSDCLPPLFSLTHVKVVSCISSVSQLLLNSYSGQLVSVETGSYLYPCRRPFTNLKQLKLEVEVKPNLSFPQLASSPFPALENLSVIHTPQPYNWLELITGVNNFPKKLTHLHLDIPIQNEEPEERTELATLSKDEVSFLFLKKLGIPFPHNKHRAESMGRWLLPKFPKLEVLQLMHYFYDFSDDDLLEEDRALLHRYIIDHNRIIDKVIAAGGFWRCSKLQKIVVFKGGDNRVMRVLTRNEVL